MVPHVSHASTDQNVYCVRSRCVDVAVGCSICFAWETRRAKVRQTDLGIGDGE